MENQSEETPLNPETFVIGKNGIPVQLKTAFALFCWRACVSSGAAAHRDFLLYDRSNLNLIEW